MKARLNGIEFEIENERDLEILLNKASGQKMSTIDEIKVDLEHRRNKIAKIVKKDKVKIAKQPIFGGNRKHKYWTTEEDKWLLENKDKLPKRVLAKTLGRSRGGVNTRLFVLLQNNDVHRDFMSKKSQVLELAKLGETNKSIAKKVGISLDSARVTIYKLRGEGLLPKLDGSYKKPKKKKGRVSKEINDFDTKLIGYLKSGASQSDAAKLMNVDIKKVYDLTYIYKQMGLLPNKSFHKREEALWSFDFVANDKQSMAKELILACSKNRNTLSPRDVVTFLGLSDKEVKPFMIDVFNQQKKLGYRVKLENDNLVFQ